MTAKVLTAYLVHLLTASGAVLGLFALFSAANGAWTESFAFLGAALVVDGIDGPLARRFDVKNVLPRISGDDLDLVIDYLTYVTVPAYIFAASPLLPPGLRYFAAGLIMIVSLYHFADKKSKTADGYFVGFPAIWNIIALYLFVIPASSFIAFAIILFCAALTFVPFRWIHPVRVRRLRPMTLAIMLIWTIAAIAALLQGFPGSSVVQGIFIGTFAYGLAVAFSDRRGRPCESMVPAE